VAVGVEDTSLGHRLELSVLGGGVGDDVVIRLRFVLSVDVFLGVGHMLDGNGVGFEVLARHLIERKGADVRVRVLLTLSQVSDERGNVFFKFSQVHGNVVLIELCVFVVLLMAGDSKLETRVIELGDHGPDVVSNADHLVLDVINLVLLSLNCALALVNLILKVCLGLLFLLGAHGVDLGVSLEFFLNVTVLLLDQVDLGVEHIHVVEKRDVLLLSLDEGRDNFINRGDSSALLDLLKGVLDDLNVSGVHVHEVLLLLVVVNNLVKTDLKENSGIGEISHGLVLLLGTLFSGSRLLSLIFVLLLQLLLKVKDAVLEVDLVHVVLGLKGKDLVLGLL